MKISCSLPNVSECINGVKFAIADDGVAVSEEVSDEIASMFAEIPGYSVVGTPIAKVPRAKKESAPPPSAQFDCSAE